MTAMTPPTVLQDDLFAALGDWLQTLVPAGVQVVQAFVNGVPAPRIDEPTMPTGAPAGFVLMRTVSDALLSMDVEAYPDAHAPDGGTVESHAPTMEWVAQVDFFGRGAQDWAKAAEMLFATDQTCTYFQGKVDGLAPLYLDPPQDAPLVDGEHQYERRRVLRLHFNYTPSVDLPQQFAAEIKIDLTNVTAVFP